MMGAGVLVLELVFVVLVVIFYPECGPVAAIRYTIQYGKFIKKSSQYWIINEQLF